MQRISGPTADGDQFTEGNPTLGIPATIVSDDWLNSVQNELGSFIESQGITLNPASNVQLQEAIGAVVEGGGITQQTASIGNGVVSFTDVTGLVFNKANIKAARILVDIQRSTDTDEVVQVGEIFVTHKSVADTWLIDFKSSAEDAGLTLAINSNGQVQYISTTLSGASYSGTIRFSHVNVLKQ